MHPASDIFRIGCSLPASGLIVGHAAGTFGNFEGSFSEVTIGLHAGQSAQRGLRFGISETELELVATDFPANQEMPAACLGYLAVQNEEPPGQIFGDDLPCMLAKSTGPSTPEASARSEVTGWDSHPLKDSAFARRTTK